MVFVGVEFAFFFFFVGGEVIWGCGIGAVVVIATRVAHAVVVDASVGVVVCIVC